MNLVGPWGTPHWADSAVSTLRRRAAGRPGEWMSLSGGSPQVSLTQGPGGGVGPAGKPPVVFPTWPGGGRGPGGDPPSEPGLDLRVQGLPSRNRWWVPSNDPDSTGGMFPNGAFEKVSKATLRVARQRARNSTFRHLAPHRDESVLPCGDPPLLWSCEAPLVKARDCDGVEVLGDTLVTLPPGTGRRYAPPSVVPGTHLHPKGLHPSAPTWDQLRDWGLTVDEGALRVELARMALDIISSNLDIVEWIGCALAPGLGDCLVKHFPDEITDVWGVHRSIRISFGDLNGSNGRAFDYPEWMTFFMFGFIPVPIVGLPACDIWLPLGYVEYWDWFVEWQRDPSKASAEGRPSVACIATMVAAVLVHEMTHCCMWETGGFYVDTSRQCATTYRVKSAFLWAMAKRYPCELGPGSSCKFFDSRDMFFSDTYSEFD